MKILAIEFSSDHRSVAVLDGERLLAEQTVTEGRDTAAVQLIESALGQAEVGRSEIECIAVGIGPGSYTGIRAAIALTQGWQLALGVKVQAVDSLEALATGEQAAGRRGEITLAVDAQRGEFYLARFELADDGIRNVEPTRLAKRPEYESLLAAGQPVIGPGLGDKFPAAEHVGRLAAGRSDFVEASELEPVYLRQVDFVKAPPLRKIPPLISTGSTLTPLRPSQVMAFFTSAAKPSSSRQTRPISSVTLACRTLVMTGNFFESSHTTGLVMSLGGNMSQRRAVLRAVFFLAAIILSPRVSRRRLPG